MLIARPALARPLHDGLREELGSVSGVWRPHRTAGLLRHRRTALDDESDHSRIAAFVRVHEVSRTSPSCGMARRLRQPSIRVASLGCPITRGYDMMRHTGQVLARAGLAIACLLTSGTWLMAQTTSASVQGTVVDSTGGVLSGTQVVLTSTTQGNALTTTTDARGNYVFPNIRPDTYTLRISSQGFKTVEMKKVVVGAKDQFNAGLPPRRQRTDGGRRGCGPRSRHSGLERRALLHVGEHRGEEHRRQRPSIFALVQLVPA